MTMFKEQRVNVVQSLVRVLLANTSLDVEMEISS
jgi:hypothetical protein